MRRYRKPGVTKFAHSSGLRRPVGIKLTGPSLGERAQNTSDKDMELVRKRLEEAGEIIAEYCRLVADRFSTRIPVSLKVKTDTKSVYILGGGPEAPNAYPFDPPRNPPVRHPVWGRGPRDKWHWANQPYRPFLEEGAEMGADKAAEQFAKIIDDWSSEIGHQRPSM